MSGSLIIAATPITPAQAGKIWAFHLVNDTAVPIESGVVESVDYEWGDMSNGNTPDLRFGAIAPGAALEIWRDDDDAAELRMSITFLIRIAGVDRKFMAEFGKLYREPRMSPVPLLNRDAALGSLREIPPPAPRVRAWHQADGFLVDRGPNRTPVVDPLSQELPEGPWRELREFAQLDAQGKVLKEYAVSVWSIDDELGMQAFAVVGGAFRELSVRTFFGSRETTREEETVLGGLREVSPWDQKTHDFLWNALRAEGLRVAERNLRLRKEGEARVAAIPAPTRDPGLGNKYALAQKVLRQRVSAYGDELDMNLLSVLGQIGMLAESLRPPRLLAAAGAFITACRLAAFDHSMDREKPDPQNPVTGSFSDLTPASQGELTRLVETLGSLHAKLLLAAEIQSDADAHLNAVEFHKAADQIARAKELLEGGFRP